MRDEQKIKIKKILRIQSMKHKEKITCLTAYDALIAEMLDDLGIDIALIGDSLGMVVQGEKDTLSVSMSAMIYHTKLVAQKCKRSYVIADMPYQSYNTNTTAIKNAQKLISAGAEMVKLEGGKNIALIIKTLLQNKINVCAHLGLQPQHVKKIGGYKVQGRSETDAKKILEDAKFLEQLGIGLLLLECVPSTLAKKISQHLKIPVIGIGAGIWCDGQVLVITDILGLSKMPSFAKDFLKDYGTIQNAIRGFIAEVKNHQFPTEKHSFS